MLDNTQNIMYNYFRLNNKEIKTMKKTMLTILTETKLHTDFKKVCENHGLKMGFIISGLMKEWLERMAK